MPRPLNKLYLAPDTTLFSFMSYKRLTQKQITTARPIRKNGLIDHFSAGRAFPGVKYPHEIIKFFGVHPTFAFRTSHVFPLG